MTLTALWAAPLVALFGAWLALAFWSGGTEPLHWLPVAFLVALLGLVVAIAVAYPRRPSQLSMVVLSMMALFTVWVTASALWAASPTRSVLEATRTGFLLLVFALALVYLTESRARRLFRYLVLAAAMVLLVAAISALWSTADTSLLFAGNRLTFPTAYANGSAALFLLPFWPLMWLAAAPAERAPVRGVALGVATGLVGLAVLTQSRSAIYTLLFTTVVVFVVSPIRLRTLLYLIVPGLLVVYAFPTLNTYWLQGPATVGGGTAARTVLVATLAGAFMGMIVALLERWIPASRRMKAVFGTVVLVAALAGTVYGSIVLTSDSGGPAAWLARSWEQYTKEAAVPVGPDATSRLAVVGSNGAVGIWKVAWAAFASQPLHGVGADNFALEYDRSSGAEGSGFTQTHSLELQVLAEAGAIGGVFLAAGVLLSLGGLLWGRWAAAWQRARGRRLRRRGHALPEADDSSSDRARWGDAPQSYGWDMALFAALAYWLIHASIDRLWDMTAVVIPALLLLAAGLASTDARVGVMWPRWQRWVSAERANREAVSTSEPQIDAPTEPGEDRGQAMEAAAARRQDTAAVDAGTFRRHTAPRPSGDDLFGPRRSDQYLTRWRKRHRRELRRRRSAERLQPPGTLSLVFRGLLIALSVVLLVASALPFVSLRYQESALDLAEADGLRAVALAGKARRLQPGYPGPFVTQAAIYAQAAAAAAPGGAAAAADDLALAVASFEKAIALDPADWRLHYQAGVATLDLMLVTSTFRGETLVERAANAPVISAIPGLRDWTPLSANQDQGRSAESPAVSLWPSYGVPESARLYRTMTPPQLGEVAVAFFRAAIERKPQAPQIARALELVSELTGATIQPPLP